MKKTNAFEKIIIKLYKNGLSMAEIAEKIGNLKDSGNWYPMKVQRVLNVAKKRGSVEVRDASQAQCLALKMGKSNHPTEGRERTDSEKKNISNGMDRYLDSISDKEERKLIKGRIKGLKKRWKSLSNEEKTNIFNKMKVGQIELLNSGTSKFEKELLIELKKRGYNPIQKYKINTDSAEIDIYLNKMHGIEVDGPTHFLPIYGEKTLEKTLKKDKKKNRIITGAGINLLRIQTHRGSSIRLISKISDEIEKWEHKKKKKKVVIINTKDF